MAMPTEPRVPPHQGVAVKVNPPAPPIGEVIRQARLGRGLTQGQLAASLAKRSANESVTREQITRWERGSRIPSPYWRQWLGEVLGLDMAQLDRAAATTKLQRLLSSAVERGYVIGTPCTDR